MRLLIKPLIRWQDRKGQDIIVIVNYLVLIRFLFGECRGHLRFGRPPDKTTPLLEITLEMLLAFENW